MLGMQVQLLKHVVHADKHVAHTDKENEAEKQQRWNAPIRDILCQKMDTGGFIFWGKTKQSDWVERLDIKWMNENKLTPELRQSLTDVKKIGRLLTLPWDLSTQTPRPRSEIQTGASLLQVLKKTKRRDAKKTKRGDEKEVKWLTRPLIDRVFAQKLEASYTGQFAFWGRLQTDTHFADKLTTCWMDANHMGVEFREKLKRKPGILFKLPVEPKRLTTRLHSKCCHEFGDRCNPMTILASSAMNVIPRSLVSPSKTSCVKTSRSLEQQPRHDGSRVKPSRSLEQPPHDRPCFKRSRSLEQPPHDRPCLKLSRSLDQPPHDRPRVKPSRSLEQPQRFRVAPGADVCAPYALLNAITNMGLRTHEKALFKHFQHHHRVSLKQCVQYFNTLGGFTHHITKAGEYHPYYNNDPAKLTLVRMCAASVNSADKFHDKRSQRVSHTIAIFNNFIFDSLRKKQPINLSIDNLHRCCLDGPEWVFHHTSEAHVFTSSPRIDIKNHRKTMKN